MSESLSKEAFTENLNTKFRVPLESSEPVELELIEVDDSGSTPRHEQFSVYFRGPLDRLLPQNTYHMEHPRMGAIALFIVPIGHGEAGFRYEAVFNRLITERE